MAEYIMKEQAELIVESALREYIRTGAVETAFEKLYSLPDADVVPVVHAKWKFVFGPDEDNNLQFMCDNCGAGDVHAANVTVPYCWKCGARMDGGDEK